MTNKLPPHPDPTMQWSPREQRVLSAHLDKAIEPLQKRIAELEADNKLLRDQNTQLDADLAGLEAQIASGQEPVAWMTEKDDPTTDKNRLPRWACMNLAIIPLYTHPAPAQRPLTLREMAAAIGTFADHAINIARAIEVAHGIKEKP